MTKEKSESVDKLLFAIRNELDRIGIADYSIQAEPDPDGGVVVKIKQTYKHLDVYVSEELLEGSDLDFTEMAMTVLAEYRDYFATRDASALLSDIKEAIGRELDKLGVRNYSLTSEFKPGGGDILLIAGKRRKALALHISQEALLHTSVSHNLEGVMATMTNYKRILADKPIKADNVVDAFINQLYITDGEITGVKS